MLTVEAANSQDEGEQGEDAALPVVVESHDEDDVLDTDDQDERPDDERQHAVHGGDVESEAVLRLEALAERVERACADVAVDDAERRQ